MAMLTRREAEDGFERFYSKKQVRFFLRNRDGSYVRDEFGKLIAIRSDMDRVFRKK